MTATPATGFTGYRVENLSSIAHLFPEKRRCGIYILCFADGQRYVGLSNDVVHRFATHRRKYADIVRIEFKPVKPASLEEVERTTIRDQEERGYILRNHMYANGPTDGDSALDAYVAEDERLAWLNDDAILPDIGPRLDDPAQRAAHRARFERLSRRADFAQVSDAVRQYVKAAIPRPKETERTFWVLSALSGTRAPAGIVRLAAVSVNMMETLVILGTDTGDEPIRGFVNLSREILDADPDRLDALAERCENAGVFLELDLSRPYRAGGTDQAALWMEGPDAFAHVLAEPLVILACRTLNLRLMRKGPTIYRRSHCYDLADLALESIPAKRTRKKR